MKRPYFSVYLFIVFICIVVLTGCSTEKSEKPYEITKYESKVTELDDRLQLEINYEISNNSDEDYYFTFVFPPYIQDALITKAEVLKLPANTFTSGITTVSASKKDGAEMTEETIEAIKKGELPFVERILIGELTSLQPKKER